MFPTWNLEASNIDTNFDVRFYCACRYNVYNAYLAGRLTTRTVTLVHRTSSSERASVCDNVASNSLPTINHNPRACRANYRFQKRYFDRSVRRESSVIDSTLRNRAFHAILFAFRQSREFFSSISIFERDTNSPLLRFLLFCSINFPHKLEMVALISKR